MKSKLLLTLFVLLANGTASGHESSCHMKNAAGVLVPEKTLESEAACRERGGQWTHPRLYCHVHSADGVVTHRADLESRFACERKGGLWEDYNPAAVPGG